MVCRHSQGARRRVLWVSGPIALHAATRPPFVDADRGASPCCPTPALGYSKRVAARRRVQPGIGRRGSFLLSRLCPPTPPPLHRLTRLAHPAAGVHHASTAGACRGESADTTPSPLAALRP